MRRRAPWWVYVVVIGGLNVVRQILFPPGRVGTLTTVALFFAVLAVSYVVVRLVAALSTSPSESRRRRVGPVRR